MGLGRSILVFVLGVIWAWGYLFFTGYWGHLPGGEENAIAKHLASGDGFSSPMDGSADAPPTCWSPPVYPFVMSIAYRLFGIGTRGAVLMLAAINVICFAIVAVCVWRIGASVLSPTAGAMGVIILFFYPPLIRFTADYWDGELSLAMFMVAMTWAAHRLLLPLREGGGEGIWNDEASRLGGRPHPDPLPGGEGINTPTGDRTFRKVTAMALGAWLGVLSLTNAAYLLSYPVIVLAACWQHPNRQKIRFTLQALLAFIVVLVPWTWRNYFEFGRMLYVRGGVQLELWNGNLPDATGWLSPASFTHHPYHDLMENGLLRHLGEMRYFDLCGQRFKQEVVDDPWAFFWRTLRRAGYLLVGDPQSPAHQYIFGIDLDRIVLNGSAVLGLAGMWAALRLRLRVGWIIIASILAETPFLVTSAGDRYAMPLRVMLAIFSALLFCVVFKTLSAGRPWHRGRA